MVVLRKVAPVVVVSAVVEEQVVVSMVPFLVVVVSNALDVVACWLVGLVAYRCNPWCGLVLVVVRFVMLH